MAARWRQAQLTTTVSRVDTCSDRGVDFWRDQATPTAESITRVEFTRKQALWGQKAPYKDVFEKFPESEGTAAE